MISPTKIPDQIKQATKTFGGFMEFDYAKNRWLFAIPEDELIKWLTSCAYVVGADKEIRKKALLDMAEKCKQMAEEVT